MQDKITVYWPDEQEPIVYTLESAEMLLRLLLSWSGRMDVIIDDYVITFCEKS